MISVNNLNFTYPGNPEPTLLDVCFEVSKREVLGFLGPSGAGKSTTQKILIGLLRQYKGDVTVMNRAVNQVGQDYYENVGVAFERPNHFLKLTALENLRYFRSLYRGETEDPLRLLELVGLRDDAARREPVFQGDESTIMSVIAVLRELTGAEWRSIRRDSMMGGMLIFVFVSALFCRWLIPWISVRFDLELVPHYPLIMSAMVVFIAPVLVGFIVGMLLLDERDEGTLQAISVTPLPMWQYLAWKLLWPVVATTILTVLTFPIVGLVAFHLKYLTALIVGAMWAPLLALIMSCCARNKVQGFVLMRIKGVLLVIPMLAWFVPQFGPLLAFFPAYWPLKSLWLAAEGKSDLLCFLVGAMFHLALIALLYRRFQAVLRSLA